jgi:hypothetical protein
MVKSAEPMAASAPCGLTWAPLRPLPNLGKPIAPATTPEVACGAWAAPTGDANGVASFAPMMSCKVVAPEDSSSGHHATMSGGGVTHTGVTLGVADRVGVALTLGVMLTDGARVALGVTVRGGVGVGVHSAPGQVATGVGVDDAVGVPVADGVGLGVHGNAARVTETSST